MIAPRSLRWRLAAWMFAVTAAVAVLLAVYYRRETHALLAHEADERLATLAGQVTAASLLGTLARSEELLAGPLDAAMSQPDVDAVAIFDTVGSTVASRSRSGVSPPAWSGATDGCRPCPLANGRLRWVAPVTGARASPAGEAGFYDGPPRAASSGASAAGWLVLDVSTAARTAAERQIATRGLAIASGVLLLGLVVTLLIAQGLTSPLRALAHATREIGKGHWDAPLPRAGSAETAQLAADFGAMTTALANLDRENSRYRDHLEDMVASRTRELERAYEDVKAMSEAKDQFVATVSHDFRSPLAIILSAVQTVVADPEMAEDVRRRFLQRAERHCKRLGAMVNDLLDLARIENRESSFESVPLSEVVRDGVESVRAAFDDRHVALAWEPPAEAIVGEVDRAQIGRALANLLDNALKFTPASGRVTVALGRADGEARIAVSDTGPGIPEEEREHVFERFFQGRQGRVLGSGSGLGLAIVAGVAKRHGGTVRVASGPGPGSTFELRLPLARL